MAYGDLKTKFRILRNVKCSMDKAHIIIMACTVLHNYIILNSPRYKKISDADIQKYEEETASIENESGLLLRDKILFFFGKTVFTLYHFNFLDSYALCEAAGILAPYTLRNSGEVDWECKHCVAVSTSEGEVDK